MEEKERNVRWHFHLFSVNMLKDGFASSPRSGRVSSLDHKVPLNVVEQVKMKSLHFAQF